MQHALVHVKYAMKCVAWCHIVSLKSTKEDEAFVQSHFKYVNAFRKSGAFENV